MSSIITIKKENIEKLVKEHPEAKQYMEILTPEVFEDGKPYVNVGSLLVRDKYPSSIYALVNIEGIVKVLNINFGTYWEKGLPAGSLKDPYARTLTKAEFREILNQQAIDTVTPTNLRDYSFLPRTKL